MFRLVCINYILYWQTIPLTTAFTRSGYLSCVSLRSCLCSLFINGFSSLMTGPAGCSQCPFRCSGNSVGLRQGRQDAPRSAFATPFREKAAVKDDDAVGKAPDVVNRTAEMYRIAAQIYLQC